MFRISSSVSKRFTAIFSKTQIILYLNIKLMPVSYIFFQISQVGCTCCLKCSAWLSSYSVPIPKSCPWMKGNIIHTHRSHLRLNFGLQVILYLLLHLFCQMTTSQFSLFHTILPGFFFHYLLFSL